MRDYESREASAAKARELLGNQWFQRFWTARMALLSRNNHEGCVRTVEPILDRTHELVEAVRALAVRVRTEAPSSREAKQAAKAAHLACSCLEIARGSLARLTLNGPGSGWVPRVAPTPDRGEFVRLVLGMERGARDIEPRAWAYFAIGAGLEDIVRGDARRDAPGMWHERRASWGTDLRRIGKEVKGAGKRRRA